MSEKSKTDFCYDKLPQHSAFNGAEPSQAKWYTKEYGLCVIIVLQCIVLVALKMQVALYHQDRF